MNPFRRLVGHDAGEHEEILGPGGEIMDRDVSLGEACTTNVSSLTQGRSKLIYRMTLLRMCHDRQASEWKAFHRH